MKFNELAAVANNPYSVLISDGVEATDESGFLDTGSYALNALISGSIFGGVPDNRVTAFAGEEATGKTFLVLSIAKKFLDNTPEGFVFYFESESALSKTMFLERGIDASRVYLMPVVTIQEFRAQAARILDKYLAVPIEERKPMLLILDSLGNLSTAKEVADTMSGEDIRDMTRAQLIKATFRVLTLKLGRAKVPLIITNHTYDKVGSNVKPGMPPPKEMGGGSGLKYAASTIVYLTRKADYDEKAKEHMGIFITAKSKKSRLTKPERKVEIQLTFDRGLKPYYGLLDIAESQEVQGLQKAGTMWQVGEGKDVKKFFGKFIDANPERFFTDEVMQRLDEAAAKEFKYGIGEDVLPPEADETTQEA